MCPEYETDDDCMRRAENTSFPGRFPREDVVICRLSARGHRFRQADRGHAHLPIRLDGPIERNRVGGSTPAGTNLSISINDRLRILDVLRNLGKQPGFVEFRHRRIHHGEASPLVPLRADQDRSAVRRALLDRIERHRLNLGAINGRLIAHAVASGTVAGGGFDDRLRVKCHQLVHVVPGQAELLQHTLRDFHGAFE